MIVNKTKIVSLGVLSFFVFGMLPSAPIKAQNTKLRLAAIAVSDTNVPEQWHLDKIKAPDAWEKTQGSEDVVVAVIDTGVDLKNPDLSNNIWTNSGEIPGNGVDDDHDGYIDDVHGWNFVENNNSPSPNLNNQYSVSAVIHGTAVAGIIAAEGNNAFAGSGVAWHAKIMPLKVFDETGDSDTVLVEQAIEYAIEHHADIINMSFVGIGYTPGFYKEIQKAYDAGILLVAAAGNETDAPQGLDMDTTEAYPVCYGGPNGENWVLGVAATDENDKRADFSNYGNQCVDISAPGKRIYSTFFHDARNPDFSKYFSGSLNGTSVAAPQVAGAAVLIKALHPSYTNKELTEVLLATADNIGESNPGFQNKLGTGRLNVLNAVNAPNIATETPEQAAVKYAISAGGANPNIWLLGAKGEVVKNFQAFPFNIGTNVAVGDADNDGIDDIVVGAAAGGGPQIRIFDLSGNVKYQFFAFDKTRRYGVIPAVGDINGDGKNEIVAMEASVASPMLRVLDNNGKILADNILISKGASIALGDVNNDGTDEIITAASGKITVSSAAGIKISEFYPFGKSFSGAMNVAVGDLAGNGWPEIMVAKKNNSSLIRNFNYLGRQLSPDLAVYGNYAGVNLFSGNRNKDGRYELITAPAGGSAEVKIWSSDLRPLMSFYPLGKSSGKILNAFIITRK